MKFEVRVFATLRKYLPELSIGQPKIMDVDQSITFDELRLMLGLPANEAKIIMCNNLQVEPEQLVHDGDRIAFIPPVAGG
jgi:molybdopterin converting factor small subunit